MTYKAILERTKQDYYQFHRLHKKLRYRVFYIILNLVVVLLIVALLAGALLLSCYRIWTATIIRYYVLLAVLFLLWALTGRLNASLAAKNQIQTGPITMEFADDEVRVSAGSLKEQYSYSAFQEIFHWKETYYFYVDKKHCVFLPERCITQGDPAAFRAFIAEKTGLEVKEVK